MISETQKHSSYLPNPIILGIAGVIGLWGTLLGLAKALPLPMTAALVIVSYSMHVLGVYSWRRMQLGQKTGWPGLVLNLAGLMLPFLVVCWIAFGPFPTVSERERATAFLEQRGLPLPTAAREVAFAVDDDFRTVAFFVRFELPLAEARSFQQKLWCDPTEPLKGERTPPAAAPWFTSEGMTRAARCDTNGPSSGPYHVDVTVGRVPTGVTRVLLSFSD